MSLRISLVFERAAFTSAGQRARAAAIAAFGTTLRT